MVVTGTCFEYDTRAGYLSEQTPVAPRSLYAASKLSLLTALGHLSERTGMALAWPRLFYQYGPCEDERRLVPAVILALLRGERALLTPGEQVRDYLHVEDVASSIFAVGMSELTGPVNVGSGQPVTVRQIARALGNIIGDPSLVALGARDYSPDDPMFVCAVTRRLREGTGWSPRWDLETGLAQTVEWFSQRHPGMAGARAAHA